MPNPPRRLRLELRLQGTREARRAVAVAWYADNIRLHDILEVCGVSVTTVLRCVTRAGIPTRDKRRKSNPARHLRALVVDASDSTLPEAEWATAHNVGARTAAAIWLLAGRTRQPEAPAMQDIPAVAPTLQRRCHACLASTTNPQECDVCHAPR